MIYDKSTNKSYCLNETAKIVFNACDGKKYFADLNLPEDIIYLSLDELKKQNLIEDNYASPFAGMSRREVVKRVGLASMVALPVILGLSAPPAVNAISACSVLCRCQCTTTVEACAALFGTPCGGTRDTVITEPCIGLGCICIIQAVGARDICRRTSS